MSTFDLAQLARQIERQIEQQGLETRRMLAAVLAAVQRQPAADSARRLKGSDRVVMGALLPLLWGRWHSGKFEAGEVAALAEKEPAVRAALGPEVGRPGGRLDQRVGHLLKRCYGAQVGGLQLVRCREFPPPPLYKVVLQTPPQTAQTDPGP